MRLATRHLWVMVLWLLLLLPSGLTLPFCLCSADCDHVEAACCAEDARRPTRDEAHDDASEGCCGGSCVLALGETEPQGHAPQVVRTPDAQLCFAAQWGAPTIVAMNFVVRGGVDRAVRAPPLEKRRIVLRI